MIYNGWTNYETWAVNLWMQNEESSYHFWKDVTFGVWNSAKATDIATRSEHARFELAEVLKEEHENQLPELKGVFADLLNAAFSEVDWYEIADNLLREHGEEYEPLRRGQHI